MILRQATSADIDMLIEVRKKQLVDEGIEATIAIDDELRTFFERKLSDETLIQWLIEDQETLISTGAFIIYDFPPSYTNKTGKKVYITNMFTVTANRGQGHATTILNKLVEGAREREITKLWLGASTLGRPVYQRFGFQATDEWMELTL